MIADLAVLAASGLLPVPDGCFAAPSLNPFLATGPATWRAVRAALTALLAADTPTLRDNAQLRRATLVRQDAATLHLPIEIAGFTDFYSSKHHAFNAGALFRDPARALLPNWSELPVGYNGRASSVIVSGTPLHRPLGQTMPPGATRPSFGPSQKLDLELEVGAIIGVPTTLGTRIKCEAALDHVFGLVLLNDWSARDIQQWEAQPLGPFNAKSFATTISPWVVTLDALAPFRCAQPLQDPEPLAYLQAPGNQNFDIALQATLRPAGSHPASTITSTNFRDMYWSLAQQLAHHTVGGCNLHVGDLIGSGTVSGPDATACGSLLESTLNGTRPLHLEGGVTRSFIQDGDEIALTGHCQGDGYRIGFGPCTGRVLPPLEWP
jgi:fumarylacetoacetase